MQLHQTVLYRVRLFRSTRRDGVAPPHHRPIRRQAPDLGDAQPKNLLHRPTSLATRWLAVIAAVALAATARGQDSEITPLPATAPAPENNATTPGKVELGKMLFFDPRLSGNNDMSCATCHIAEKAFVDRTPTSPGSDGQPLPRNTQSCLNVGFYDRLFWDGRSTSLEAQALEPLKSTVEMNQDLAELEAELGAIGEYARRFEQVFGSPPTRDSIAQALAAFQRTLNTGPSAFDRYLAGDRRAISREARRGWELFRGEAGCIECHHGPMLSDGEFYRLGVSFRDQGRGAVTGDSRDRFRFRTPSLRNVAETPPYMHDGSLETLEQVVEFYYRGIPDQGPGGLSIDTSARRDLSFADIEPMVAFLRTLSGEPPQIEPPTLP